ncbi:nucleotide sugar dehydrogenase [Umezawaea endophytica]|uniref:Nucleotide sugar dehydrogenase n=1 Tax=Umezawaea endophytica TaxID=1654476 RepID=A0A9X2VM86_9PSEU|nr:nucleotide sugar dehydrogenase [Umezawaea endophytica]MCS7479120.1 nucleotide sugar dehydrogenase [Umezawaea endophytica]
MSAVTVIGLGKIGLPLAVLIAESGRTTYGVDIQQSVIDAVGLGQTILPDEPDLPDRLQAVVRARQLLPTLDLDSAVGASEVVVVIIPLVVDENGTPLFESLDSTTERISHALLPGSLVIYETTLPVGTTRHRFFPVLREKTSNLFLAYSPERVSSGSVFAGLRGYPKLIGGVDDASAERTRHFYESVFSFDDRPDLNRPNGVWDLGSTEAAELVKLAETTYRDVNIAFANELAEYSETLGLDVTSVITAANSQPFSHIHRPGLVGGHCIPVYPWFLLAGAPDMRLPRVAREVNSTVPDRVLARLVANVGDLKGLRVVVLGLAYRGGVRESSFSGALALVKILKAAEAVPLVHDPLWTSTELATLGLRAYQFGESCDCAVVQSDHIMYKNIGPSDLPGVRTVFDLRAVTRTDGWGGVRRLVLGCSDFGDEPDVLPG